MPLPAPEEYVAPRTDVATQRFELYCVSAYIASFSSRACDISLVAGVIANGTRRWPLAALRRWRALPPSLVAFAVRPKACSRLSMSRLGGMRASVLCMISKSPQHLLLLHWSPTATVGKSEPSVRVIFFPVCYSILISPTPSSNSFFDTTYFIYRHSYTSCPPQFLHKL
jgi:hypothetical protein